VTIATLCVRCYSKIGCDDTVKAALNRGYPIWLRKPARLVEVIISVNSLSIFIISGDAAQGEENSEEMRIQIVEILHRRQIVRK
jgi:hypothetical protein